MQGAGILRRRPRRAASARRSVPPQRGDKRLWLALGGMALGDLPSCGQSWGHRAPLASAAAVVRGRPLWLGRTRAIGREESPRTTQGKQELKGAQGQGHQEASPFVFYSYCCCAGANPGRRPRPRSWQCVVGKRCRQCWPPTLAIPGDSTVRGGTRKRPPARLQRYRHPWHKEKRPSEGIQEPPQAGNLRPHELGSGRPSPDRDQPSASCSNCRSAHACRAGGNAEWPSYDAGSSQYRSGE